MKMECKKRSAEKKYNNYKKLSLHRIAILCGVLAIVVIIVYITPMPEKYFLSCERPCHELDWPMICRVKLTMEVYKTLSKACGDCPGNLSECSNSHCISADGYQRGILSANRILPGPSIQVCVNDILVVDVVNRVPGQGLSIHWRGMPQKETPFMDGVPMVTQCPIPSYTTFQYKFRASQPGTHLYHAHSGAETADGIFGALIVREPDKIEPMRKLYDKDETSHVIVISEWSHDFAIQNLLDLHPSNIESVLINGKGVNVDGESSDGSAVSVFKVKPGLRYRFRVAYVGGVNGCQVALKIDNHNLILIALDGHPVVAKEVSSVVLGRGERLDFVLNANKSPDSYQIRVSTGKDCSQKVESVAVLRYENTKKVTFKGSIMESEDSAGAYNYVTGMQCIGDGDLCLSDMQSIKLLPETLREKRMDTTLYLPFYHTRLRTSTKVESLSGIDSIHFTFPTSPLLTQEDNVPARSVCDSSDGSDLITASSMKECVHIKQIKLGDTVEIVLFDQGGESDHVFHLHGYSFFVVAIRQFNETLAKDVVKKMHDDGTLFPERNLINPVKKDTIVIPKFGAAALRFTADNPGYWMLRDEGSNHWTRGLDVVLRVGESGDFVKAPVDFPKCGDYIGPEYFLI